MITDTDKIDFTPNEAELPILRRITLPLNRNNIPSWLFGSIGYQKHPVPTELDGVSTWYHKFFEDLSKVSSSKQRAEQFVQFMQVRFGIKNKKDKNASTNHDHVHLRPRVNYRRLILGWLFDSDSEQGAAWRGWVESRFGLVTNYYKGSATDSDSKAYWEFRELCQQATHNTNELFEQLDLLYYFCQLELKFLNSYEHHIKLYRGCAESTDYEIDGKQVKLFNNLSSFTSDPEAALLFGSKVYEVTVPLTKIVCYESLLPGSLKGENEFMVMGGLYVVERMKL